MNRQEMVDFLIDCDVEYIRNSDNDELLRSYLDIGFTGYSNFSDLELPVEVKERKAMMNL